MIKLLKADFCRMFKSKLIYAGIFVMIGFSLLATISRVYEGKILGESGYNTPDGLLFNGIMFLSVIIALINSMFIGTDTSDGTLRNKIIVGHSRYSICFSYWVVTSVCSVALHLAYIVPTLIVSSFALDSFTTSISVNIALMFCSVFTVIAINSFEVRVCILSPNKAGGVVLCVVLTMGLWSLGLGAWSSLSQPQYYAGYSYEDANGIVQVVPPMANPEQRECFASL